MHILTFNTHTVFTCNHTPVLRIRSEGCLQFKADSTGLIGDGPMRGRDPIDFSPSPSVRVCHRNAVPP